VVRSDVEYARSGELLIAYQVVGEGPLDVVVAHGWAMAFWTGWEEPHVARFYEHLAAQNRLILFDTRGTGMSDKVSADDLPDLETRMDDLRAVLDAAGSERAVLYAVGEAGMLCVLFAATFPERTAGLILYCGWPASENPPEVDAEPLGAAVASVGWRRDLLLEYLADAAPSLLDDPAVVDWWVRSARLTLSPGGNTAYDMMMRATDVRPVLPSVHVPALLLCPRNDAEYGPVSRNMAEAIPDASLVEIDGRDHAPWGKDLDAAIPHVDAFLSGIREAADLDRVLATVLFTDIVSSTERAAALGDHAWQQLLDTHHAIMRAHLARYRGREIDTAGDGFLASFDGPARAVRCGQAVVAALRDIGLDVRAGVHTGECQLAGRNLRGIAVHIGSRVSSEAAAGEVLVTSTVRDLVAGSGLDFQDRGERHLKGIHDPIHLYAAASSSRSAAHGS
jgi:class 3 adenylate cyclase